MRKNSEGAEKWRGIDGVVKNPISTCFKNSGLMISVSYAGKTDDF